MVILRVCVPATSPRMVPVGLPRPAFLDHVERIHIQPLEARSARRPAARSAGGRPWTFTNDKEQLRSTIHPRPGTREARHMRARAAHPVLRAPCAEGRRTRRLPRLDDRALDVVRRGQLDGTRGGAIEALGCSLEGRPAVIEKGELGCVSTGSNGGEEIRRRTRSVNC